MALVVIIERVAKFRISGNRALASKMKKEKKKEKLKKCHMLLCPDISFQYHVKNHYRILTYNVVLILQYCHLIDVK